jgi:hypothetical protein
VVIVKARGRKPHARDGRSRSSRPDAATVGIVADAVGFCRLVGNRITPADLRPHITGNAGRATEILAAATTRALD